MKKVFISIIVALLLIPTLLIAQPAKAGYVRGYYRSNGTYVSPYYRSNPNSYKWDNYSSRGNYNPYTGKKGYNSWY